MPITIAMPDGVTLRVDGENLVPVTAPVAAAEAAPPVESVTKAEPSAPVVETTKAAFIVEGRGLMRKADEPDDAQLHYITAVVMEPNPPELGVTKDTQRHCYSETDIFKAMCSYMRQQGVGLFHENPDVKGFRLIENWQLKADAMPADLGLVGTELLQKGTWLQTQEVDAAVNPAAWDGIVKGEYTAFSIEGTGELTPLSSAGMN